jgi:hypothetical protein
MVGRRSVLVGLGALGGVGAAAAVGAGPLLGANARSGASLDSPLELAGVGVGPGATFASCTVQSVARSDDGAILVSMTGADGRQFELELLGHDARTPGVARAGSLAVYVNNQGRGDTATDEAHGLAAMALARHLAGHEAAGGVLPLAPTMAERAAHGGIARARLA